MKNAKRSVIITAILAIIMCASLAAGATFALFTSSSKVNIVISSANVEVNADVKVTKTWHEDNNVEKAGLYDTGKAEVTYENNQAKLTLSNFVPTDGVKLAVSLKNESTVKIKYRVLLLADRTVGTELLDELDIDMNGMAFRGYTLATEYVELEAGASIDDIPVTIVFPKEADKGMNVTCNLAIKVEAQQGNAVADNSVDVPDGCVLVKETKDEATWYSVVSAAALNDGVEEKVDFSSTLSVSEGNTTITATNKTIENTNDLWDSKPNAWSLVSARSEGTELTINDGIFKAKANDCYAVDVQDGATVEINGGTFIGNIHAVYVQKGTAIINGGFYSVQQKYPDASKANEFVLNCYDANRAAGTAKIIVTGGTFVNFNPADCQAEGAHTNFVKEGYKVVSETKEKEDGTTEVWYTVVSATAKVDNITADENGTIAASDVTTAIAGAFENDDGTTTGVEVTLPAGEIDLKSNDTLKSQLQNKNKDITFVGAGDSTVYKSAGEDKDNEANGDYAFDGSKSVTFKNMTIDFNNAAGKPNDWCGFIRAQALYFENCTIKGMGHYWGVGEVVFKNCNFESDYYNIHLYSGKSFTFENCTFNSKVGRFINAYQQTAQTVEVNIIDCKFICATSTYAAIYLKPGKNTIWKVSFSGTNDVATCAIGNNTDSRYYDVRLAENNYDFMAESTVTINNVVVWENGAKKRNC